MTVALSRVAISGADLAVAADEGPAHPDVAADNEAADEGPVHPDVVADTGAADVEDLPVAGASHVDGTETGRQATYCG
jgi:hypothetical protein